MRDSNRLTAHKPHAVAMPPRRASSVAWRLGVSGFFACIVVGVLYISANLFYGLHHGSGEMEDGHETVALPPIDPVATRDATTTITYDMAHLHNTSARLSSWPTLYMTSAGDPLPRRQEDVSSRHTPFRRSQPLYGNGRAVIPLLLTSTKYHGTSLFATTIQGWILKLLLPQRNIDLIVFYDVGKVSLTELVQVLRIHPRPPAGNATSGVASIDPKLLVDVTLSKSDVALLGDGYFMTSYHATFSFRLHPVRLPFPDYLVASNLSQLDDASWMRCGCPPVCPQKRATVDYVQGTRWYTYDLFLQPIVKPYSFWIKLDVDIWMMREMSFNMVDTLVDKGAIFAHTGYIYNGHGCSNELHKAIKEYCAEQRMQPVAADQAWWRQDDNVYYSNFVISSMAFHLSSDHMRLAKALTEYPTGFFKYRWTDQSLFHKVFGVFYGPQESDFLLDWGHLRCSKKRFRKGAVFYHSKGKKKSSVLRLCTDI